VPKGYQVPESSFKKVHQLIHLNDLYKSSFIKNACKVSLLHIKIKSFLFS
jgi:hypothetical protein